METTTLVFPDSLEFQIHYFLFQLIEVRLYIKTRKITSFLQNHSGMKLINSTECA